MNITLAIPTERTFATLEMIPFVQAKRTTIVSINHGHIKYSCEVDTKELISMLRALEQCEASMANS